MKYFVVVCDDLGCVDTSDLFSDKRLADEYLETEYEKTIEKNCCISKEIRPGAYFKIITTKNDWCIGGVFERKVI